MTVSVNGAELSYTTRGSGPACMVLSAIGTAPYVRQMPPPLTDHLTLVHVDLRGGGQSTGVVADLTFDQLANDLDAVRGALGLGRVAVLGHSILGVLAIEYGRRRPTSVSHVIAVGTPPTGDLEALAAHSRSFFEEDASDARKQRLRDNVASLPPEPSMGLTLLAQTPMRFHDADVDAAPLFEGAVSRPELPMHIMGTLMPAWRIDADPDSLRAPLLLAHGRHDYTVPYVLWDGIPPTLPNATFQIFEQSGHQPFFEEPERFTAVLTRWMADQTSRRPGGG